MPALPTASKTMTAARIRASRIMGRTHLTAGSRFQRNWKSSAAARTNRRMRKIANATMKARNSIGHARTPAAQNTNASRFVLISIMSEMQRFAGPFTWICAMPDAPLPAMMINSHAMETALLLKRQQGSLPIAMWKYNAYMMVYPRTVYRIFLLLQFRVVSMI